jgi:hypothetical protein
MRVPNETGSSPRRPWAIAVAILVAVPLAAGVVYAAIPDAGTGEITVCYKPYTGQMRLIDTESVPQCASDEQPLSWDQQGGITGLEIVSRQVPGSVFGFPVFNSQSPTPADVDCSAGKRVLGTGVEILHAGTAPGTITIEAIRPTDADTVEARAAEILTGTGDNWGLRVAAVCADAS